MSGYTVDTRGLAANAPSYQDAADQVQAVYDTLSGTLQSYGACWGDDDAGQQFAAKYVNPALSALQSLVDNGTGMESMVDGIYTWAKSYVSADDAAKDHLTQELGY
ncbi:MAG: hypothetical protein M3Y33_09005 [Actinomycetota bacterium]|nr:hypothetical protein [Actinomycetota bacterium]